jgi:hypothetical protein
MKALYLHTPSGQPQLMCVIEESKYSWPSTWPVMARILRYRAYGITKSLPGHEAVRVNAERMEATIVIQGLTYYCSIGEVRDYAQLQTDLNERMNEILVETGQIRPSSGRI